MLRRTLNLGILAHVDAGKTTLTERLLYAAGVIDEIGSVDDGSTQTDTLALERQRGITIKSAVVSFRDRRRHRQPHRHAGPPGLHRRGGARAERARRRRARDLRRRRRAVADAVAHAGAATAARPDAAVREQGRPPRRGLRPRRAGDLRTADDARSSRWRSAGSSAFRDRLAEALAERDEAILDAYVDDESIPYDRLCDGACGADEARRSCIRCSSARRSPAPAWTR